MRRGRGLKPSTPDRIAHRSSILGAKRLIVALSGGCILDAPAVVNQTGYEVCWGASLAAGLWTSCNASHKPLPWLPSVLDIVSMGYSLIRARANPTGPLPPLADTGAELQDGDDVIATWGVTASQPFVGDTNCDLPPYDPASPIPEPDTLQAELMAQRLVVGPYSEPVDSAAPQTVAQCLDSGVAVWVGGLVGAAVQAIQPGQIEQPTPESDPTAGGHARFIRGYRTVAGGHFEYLVRNSWGASWCGSGENWASEEWLLAQWNLFPLAVL